MENELGWASPGVRVKPPGCALCPYSVKGSGFCGDYYGKEPKIALLLDHPNAEDVVEQITTQSKEWRVWIDRLITPLGRKREDLIVANTIRCHPPGGEYPSGWLRVQAEKNCRQYDTVHTEEGLIAPGNLETWGPDIFLITYHPREFFKIGAYYRQTLKDIEKAFSFADRGYKPCVLMGIEAATLVAPWLMANGGIKTWRSHWYEGSWPFKGGVDVNKALKLFKEAKSFREQYRGKQKKISNPRSRRIAAGPTQPTLPSGDGADKAGAEPISGS